MDARISFIPEKGLPENEMVEPDRPAALSRGQGRARAPLLRRWGSSAGPSPGGDGWCYPGSGEVSPGSGVCTVQATSFVPAATCGQAAALEAIVVDCGAAAV
jgi:hypothetical protein